MESFAPNHLSVFSQPERGDIRDLLREANEKGASDVHFSAGETPMFRVHGKMARIDGAPISSEQSEAMLLAIMTEEQREKFAETNDIDFSIQLDETARFRVNVLRQNRGASAVFRKIPTKILSLEQLNMPPILGTITKREKGLVLVTGPTGSGKSTTLAAMIDLINQHESKHILTIEDPIEFVHQSKKSLITQREIGPHTKSFATALRAALREDPDVILVGEMRDLETIQLALTAAETGHLVFGTLHTSSAPKTVDRIIDVFPQNQQAQVRTMLAESLEAVVTQTLCSKIEGGRVAALEILVGSSAVRNLIRENKIFQIPSVMQTSKNLGMQTLDAHLKDLIDAEMITMETATEKLGGPLQLF